MPWSILLLVGISLSLTVSLVIAALTAGWISRHPALPRRRPIVNALTAILLVNSWWIALGALVVFKVYVLRQDT